MNQGTVTRLVDTIIPLFDPIVQAINSADSAERLFKELGYLPPAEVTLFQDFSAVLDALLNIIDQIDEIVNNDADPDYLQLSKDTIDALTAIIELINDISTLIQNNFQGAFLAQTDILAKFPRKLMDYLLIRALKKRFPVLHSTFLVAGIIDETFVTDTPTPFNIPYLKREIRWEKIPDFFTNPLQTIQQSYKWNTADFEYIKLINNLRTFSNSVRFQASVTSPSPDTLKAFNGGVDVATEANKKIISVLEIPFLPSLVPAVGGEIYPILNAAKDKVEGIGLGIYFDPSGGLQFRITDNITLGVKYIGTSQLDAGIVIKPGQPLQTIFNVFGSSTGTVDLSNFIPEFIYGKENENTVVFDSSFGAKFEFKSWTVRGGSLSGGGMFFETEIKGGTITLGGGKGDGFLTKILPSDPMKADFDVTIGFSTESGLYFKGSSALEIRFPVHIDIGPIALEGLTLGIKFKDGKIPLSVGADIKASLGPLVAVVQNMGVTVNLSFPQNRDGNLGPLQLDLGFKPPNGVGLSIDAGVIKGGGFLYLDFDKGEYFGAIELEFQDLFALKAIGIINTKNPDGSPGFSMLVIITAEFTPIQLGYGFTLNGVGGLLGLNRTSRIEILREGVKTGAIKSVLFPEDVVANITRIISDLKQIFPPQEGRFLVGPMAELGWGNSIISLQLGILLEIPVPRIAILGVLKLVLPDEDNKVLKLQVNFLGVIDFENSYISFDASLYDSKLLIFTLTGDMAFRLSWGANPVFILSVGGFHPAFKDAPADLQNMKRLSISLLSGDNPRITISNYFAITSNTVQFGAKAELYAAACGFNIYGYFGFDVLFHFIPFNFIASIYAGLALRKGNSVIMGIRVSGELSGPTPWDAKGEASFSILFFDVTISFHETWGDNNSEGPPDKADIITLLTAEINDNGNWKADIPDINKLYVSIKKIELTPDKVVVHPFGVLTFSERLVPLELDINKFGNQVPKDATRFEVKVTDPALGTESVKEQFAPANFRTMKDNEKLSAPSFEMMKSGFKISGSSALQIPQAVNKSVDYEITYLRKKIGIMFFAGIYKYAKKLFKANTKTGAIAKSPLSYSVNRKSANAPEAVTTHEEQFAIANTSDLKLHSNEMVAGSYAEAAGMYDQLIAKQPALKGKVQIVSKYEINPN